MAAKRRHAPYPKPIEGAELIVKHEWEHSSRFDDWLAPSVFILGNKGGYRWLSLYFAWLADEISEDSSFSRIDPADHQHLDVSAPFNWKLSDEIGLMLGKMPDKHRSRILKASRIRRKTKLSGGPIVQFLHTLRDLADYFGSRRQTMRSD